MTVIPLFCSRFLQASACHRRARKRDHRRETILVERFNAWLQPRFQSLLDFYESWVRRALIRPGTDVAVLSGVFRAEPRDLSRCSASPSSRAPMPASSPST